MIEEDDPPDNNTALYAAAAVYHVSAFISLAVRHYHALDLVHTYVGCQKKANLLLLLLLFALFSNSCVARYAMLHVPKEDCGTIIFPSLSSASTDVTSLHHAHPAATTVLTQPT